MGMKTFTRILYSIVLLLSCSCINDEPTDVEEVVTLGSTLPDFAVVMNDGTTLTGEMLRSSDAVIMFFHTSCPDCRQALPLMQQLYDVYVQEGVMFALISREEDDPSVSAYWEESGFTMPYSAQSDRKVYELFARRRVPRIYMNDSRGVVRHIFTDDPVPSYENLVEALEEILL